MPFSEIVAKTRLMIPIGAKLIIQTTICEVTSAAVLIRCFVSLLAAFKASPKTKAHDKTPI
ncbi:Uncharacterised protein [Chlamydia trachomatis]|nr:Uncharacterised protein [Chlamydia trachomatis]